MNIDQNQINDQEFIDEDDLEEVIDLDDDQEQELNDDNDDADCGAGGDNDNNNELEIPKSTKSVINKGQDTIDDSLFTFELHEQSVFCCHVSHDDRYAVTGGQDDKAIVWSVENEKYGTVHFDTNGHHKDSIISVKFNLNSKMVATGDMSGMIIVWNVENGEKIDEYDVGNDLNWLLWHNALENVLMAGSQEAWIWRISTTKPQCRTLQSFGCANLIAELFSDGRRLAMGYEDGSIRVWNIEQNQIVLTLQGYQAHQASITSLALSFDDNNLIATGSANGSFKLINVKSEKVIHSFQLDEKMSNNDNDDDNEKSENSIESIQFCGQNCLILSSLDGRIQIWHIPSQTKRNEINLSCGVCKLLVDSNDKNVVYAGCLDGMFRVIDIRNGEILAEKHGHHDQMLDFSIFYNSNFVLTCSDDSTCKIFKIK